MSKNSITDSWALMALSDLVRTTMPWVTGVAQAGIGLGAAYGIYAMFGVLAFLLVKKMLTETRGLTLEQISRDHQ